MSRYVVASDKNEVIVGWDNPLQTYFFSVTDETGDEIAGNAMFPGEIQTIDRLQKAMDDAGVGAQMNVVVRERLAEDLHGATEPTPLQKRMAAMFSLNDI